jgi:hypothetical protein
LQSEPLLKGWSTSASEPISHPLPRYAKLKAKQLSRGFGERSKDETR